MPSSRLSFARIGKKAGMLELTRNRDSLCERCSRSCERIAALSAKLLLIRRLQNEALFRHARQQLLPRNREIGDISADSDELGTSFNCRREERTRCDHDANQLSSLAGSGNNFRDDLNHLGTIQLTDPA